MYTAKLSGLTSLLLHRTLGSAVGSAKLIGSKPPAEAILELSRTSPLNREM